ncbi:hypothetical protein WA158_007020 [Blastocystis sp. Blastoise]
MSQQRKVKSDIEKTLKRIQERLESFESIWDRVYKSQNQTQKEKYEGDLKKEIKKLQRDREQVKNWLSSADTTIKSYEKQLNAARETIENRMLKFRECEKETKTKAFSKEGLAQGTKRTPEEEKHYQTCEFIRQSIRDIKKQSELLEADIVAEKSKAKRNANSIQDLEKLIKIDHYHIENLEIILRLLYNHLINIEEILDYQEDITDFIEHNQDPDYYATDSLYEDLHLETYQNVTPMEPDNMSDFDGNSDSDASNSDDDEDSRSSSNSITSSTSRNRSSSMKSGDKSAVSSIPSTPQRSLTRNNSITSSSSKSVTPLDIQEKLNSMKLTSNNGRLVSPQKTSTNPQFFKETSPAVISSKAVNSPKPVSNLVPVSSPLLSTSVPMSKVIAASALAADKNNNNNSSRASSIPTTTTNSKVNNNTNNNSNITTANNTTTTNNNNTNNNNNTTTTSPTNVPVNNNSKTKTNNDSQSTNTSPLDPPSVIQPSSVSPVPPSYNPITPQTNPIWTTAEIAGYLSAGYKTIPRSSDWTRNPMYIPRHPVQVPDSFPSIPTESLNVEALWKTFQEEILFIAFGLDIGTYHQYLAAKTLKSSGWRYIMSNGTWYNRKEEPTIKDSKGEKSDCFYYDYTSWKKQSVQNYQINYDEIEDEPL